MAARLLSFLLFLSCLLLTSCGGPAPVPAGGQRRLEQLKEIHPRLVLTAEKKKALKSSLQTTHKFLWDRYLQDLPDKLESAREPLPQNLNRGHGDRTPDLCFAWLMTGDPGIFETAKNNLLGLARSPQWDPTNDLIHGHLLQGMALGYDWLYPDLNAEERKLVADRLALACEKEYERMTVGRVWYHNQYFQNHGISNFCGLAYAAAALYGEDPRAVEWLKNCEDFFEIVFRTLPADGTSLEGLSYGGYDFEYILRYAELAKNLLGRDYYDTQGLKEMPAFFLHSLVPRPTEDEWAMTFGDAPRHANWHGPEPQLFRVASQYSDSTAQWLGKFLINLREKGLAGAGWWSLLWYDPAIPGANPANFPTFHHFTENDQAMMRSSWTDPNAMLVGTLCGPFMGKVQSLTAEWDWGTNHQHPDKGSFQIFAHGQFLAIDPLYTGFKLTANHNCMLFKNHGQMGEEIQWFGVAEALYYSHYPQIVHAVTTAEYDYVVANLARAYHPALGLEKYERHFLFIKPDVLILADRITLDDKGALYTYPSEELKTSGGLEHNREGYVVGPQGEASLVFEGGPGIYTITANYLDNHAGAGQYSLVVDDKTVHNWQSTSQVSDNYFIVSPEVELKMGSRIVFRAAPMAGMGRLLRMTVYSRQAAPSPVPAPPVTATASSGKGKLPEVRGDVRWLLHFDSKAEIEEAGNGVTATLGDACLDVIFNMPAEMLGLNWEFYTVKKPHTEIKETKRLSVYPRFIQGRANLLALFHARGKDEPRISRWGAGGSGEEMNLDFSYGDRQVVLLWNFEKRKLMLTINPFSESKP
ncbi:MAG TPA: DUF4962 domain-containing protein [archaeon]|nr:DUF4962 domain-containing protein [archaeon]